VHRQAPQAQPPTPPAPTGVDYLGLVLAAHDAETLGQLAFRDLHLQQPEDDQPKQDRIEDHQVEERQPHDQQPAEELQAEEDHQA
jgi:hypothetical protein